MVGLDNPVGIDDRRRRLGVGKRATTPLYVEWTPNWVRAVNGQSGESASGPSLAALGDIVRGQQQALVGVGHNHVFLKAIRLPKAAPDDLRNIIAVQLGQLFPVPPDQLSFDFIQTSDQTVDGFLTIVAAMRADLLRDLRAELKEVGLNAVRILPISLVSPVIAARAGHQDALVVEQGNAGLTLDVVQGGVIRFSRFAPDGSDSDIEAKRTLSAAKCGDASIVTVGSVSISGATRSAENPLLLLQEALPFDFELMEERVQAVKKRVAVRMRLAALFAVVAAGLLVTAYILNAQASDQVRIDQNQWAHKASILTSTESKDAAKASQLSAITAGLNQAFDPAQPISDISAVVNDCLPKGAWLTGITIERGKPVDIRGTASTPGDVTSFVSALGDSPRLRSVAMVFANSTTIGETPVVQFDIGAVAIGNLPMPVAAKKTSASTSSSTTNLTASLGQEAQQ